MANAINPLELAIDNWLDRIEHGSHCAAFRDAWLRLNTLSTADLELTPSDLGPHNASLLLAIDLKSFGKPLGSFCCAVRDGRAAEEKTVIISAPTFSSHVPEGLRQATLSCLFRLAPPKSVLEVVLDDDVSSPTSTLEVAGRYTDAGWGLDPKSTELISERPRRWVFRFTKN